MSVNPISTNQFYGDNENNTSKTVKEVVHYLQDNRVYTHLDRETRNKWQVLFYHNRPVTSKIVPALASSVGIVVTFASLTIAFGLSPLNVINTCPVLLLVPGILGSMSVGILIYDVVKYREGKRVADQEISRDRFEGMIQQIKESLEPQKALYDSIQ